MPLATVSIQRVTPERFFWCTVINEAVIEASQGNVNAQRWFHSDMWDTVSSLLFKSEIARAIEDKALSGEQIGKTKRRRYRKSA